MSGLQGGGLAEWNKQRPLTNKATLEYNVKVTVTWKLPEWAKTPAFDDK